MLNCTKFRRMAVTLSVVLILAGCQPPVGTDDPKDGRLSPGDTTNPGDTSGTPDPKGILHVSVMVGDDLTGNGSQSQPYASVQKAITELKKMISVGEYAEIRIAAGLYTLSTGLCVPEGFILRGGYRNNAWSDRSYETASDRDNMTYRTELRLAGSAISTSSDSAENPAVITSADTNTTVTTAATFEGLVITTQGYSGKKTTALQISSMTEARISACTLKGPDTTLTAAGRGLCICWDSRATVTNCLVEGGGAISATGITCHSAVADISGCTIRGCSVSGWADSQLVTRSACGVSVSKSNISPPPGIVIPPSEVVMRSNDVTACTAEQASLSSLFFSTAVSVSSSSAVLTDNTVIGGYGTEVRGVRLYRTSSVEPFERNIISAGTSSPYGTCVALSVEGFDVPGGDNLIRNNTITVSRGTGAEFLKDSSMPDAVLFSGNIVTAGGTGIPGAVGISIASSNPAVTISGNTISILEGTGTGTGISGSGVAIAASVRENTLNVRGTGRVNGIAFDGLSNTSTGRPEITGNTIDVRSEGYVTTAGMEITEAVGIMLSRYCDAVICGNTITVEGAMEESDLTFYKVVVGIAAAQDSDPSITDNDVSVTGGNDSIGISFNSALPLIRDNDITCTQSRDRATGIFGMSARDDTGDTESDSPFLDYNRINAGSGLRTYGIRISTACLYPVIRGNSIWAGNGITETAGITTASSYTLIAANFIHSGTGANSCAIRSDSNTTATVIAGNSIVGGVAGCYGVYSESSGVWVVGNIISGPGSGGDGIYNANNFDMTIENNDIHGFTILYRRLGQAPGTGASTAELLNAALSANYLPMAQGNVSVDPAWVDKTALDLRLTAASPAALKSGGLVLTAQNIPPQYPTFAIFGLIDAAGTPRGSPCAMGACEWE